MFGPIGILGKEEVGATLVARVNGVVPWHDLEANSEVFTWYRDGVPIEDSDKITYRLSEKDVDKEVKVEYTFRTKDGQLHTILSKDFARIPNPKANYWKYLYNKYLDREPDEEGLKWWQDRIEQLFKDSLG